MPEVSIITPSFNRATLLPRLWQSIASQNADFEWIIVDDASEDETERVVSRFNDPRISYIRMTENRGVNAARNAGVSASSGRFIIFLDSDDELYPEALPYAIDSIMNADGHTGVMLFSCVLAESGRVINEPADGKVLNEYDIVCGDELAGGDMICLYRREVFDSYKLPEKLRGCEQVFVYEISKKYNFEMVNKPLSIVHRQSDNLSGSSNMVKRSLDIARSYELLLENHSTVLNNNDRAFKRYLEKAIYRYGVAGSRGDAWRVYRRLWHADSSFTNRIKSSSLMVFCLLGPSLFEAGRINRLTKKLRSSKN